MEYIFEFIMVLDIQNSSKRIFAALRLNLIDSSLGRIIKR